MDALGIAVPPAMQALIDKTQEAAESTSFLDGTIAKMALSFSAGALLDRAGQMLEDISAKELETAESTVLLSEKFGISVDSVQRLSYAADLTGTSVESMGKSMQIFSKNLVEGGRAI